MCIGQCMCVGMMYVDVVSMCVLTVRVCGSDGCVEVVCV